MASLPFDQLNEADVREAIIAPLLQRLGYSTGSSNDIRREQPLRHPAIFLGRKKKTDVPLRGRPDYILSVGERLNWVLEAKPPYPEISDDDIEQAWSYANHAGIRGVYFAVCNGRVLQIFRTQDAPNCGPFATFSYAELDARFAHLSNILSPTSISRDFPNTVPDYGVPLGPGLRSIAKGTGWFEYSENSANSLVLQELRVPFQCAVERVEEHIVVYLEIDAPLRSLKDWSERVGLARFEMVGSQGQFSESEEAPIILTYENQITFSAGEEFPNFDAWQTVVLPTDVSCKVRTQAECYLADRRLIGTFETITQIPDLNVYAQSRGPFQAELT